MKKTLTLLIAAILLFGLLTPLSCRTPPSEHPPSPNDLTDSSSVPQPTPDDVSKPISKPESTPSEALEPPATTVEEAKPADIIPERDILFSEDFESGVQNWAFFDGAGLPLPEGQGWWLEKIDDNTVLRGEGHNWARLRIGDWDNYVFRARFKILQGAVHFNYRLSGKDRYFIRVSSAALSLQKQKGDDFYDLAETPISLDTEWHDLEIRGYGGLLNILVDGELLLLHKDESPLVRGSIGFESLGRAECLISEVSIVAALPADLVSESPQRSVRDTGRSGRLAADETWSGEIRVTGQVVVPEGITLTIEPGTVVKFQYSRDYRNFDRGVLLVDGGTLNAIGTPEKPIWFTSDAEQPINGDWEGIGIENSQGDNIVKYAIVEYAFIGIRFWTASGTVANSIVRWMNAEGIYMERSNVTIENNTIYGTGYNGIAMEQFNDVIIRNNRIVDNQGSGIHGEATKAVIEGNIVRNSRTGITFDDFSEAVLRNNLIENIRYAAVHFYVNSVGRLFFNEIRNSGTGISSSESSLTANNNDIHSNTRNVRLDLMQESDLRENWWGTTDINSIKDKIDSDATVFVEPFLAEETVNISEPVYDYQDVRKTEPGYIPGDPEDKYPYIYLDEDETRRVVKKTCGAEEGFSRYGFGWSLAWDGKYLWRTQHAGGGDIIKIDPETGRIVASLGNPGIAQDRGMAFDGKSLWVNDFSALKVFEVSPETGKILSSFKIPEMGSGSSGIAWDGEYLYLVDWLKREEPGAPLYKVDRQGNLTDTIRLEKGGGASITFDGQYFWVSPSGKGIRKYDKQGKLVGEIYAAAFGGEAIAHDGEYLWVLHRTQELWSDPKLYQIEVIDDQVLLK